MHMAVIQRCHSFYEMNMLAIADRDGRPGSNFFQVVEVVQEIGVREIDFMYVAVADRDYLARNSGETVIMSVRSLFR